LAHICCGQMAGWINMPLGTQVGLDLSNIVLDGDPAASFNKKGQSVPVFGPCLLRPNGWMEKDATWYGSRPRPRPHCVRLEPATPRKGHNSPPPLFDPCLLWPRSPISATAELLYVFFRQCVFDMAALRSRCGHYLCPDSSSFLFIFFTKSHRSQTRCLPCTSTWCGLRANLECRSEMYCTRLAENIGRKIVAKNRHHGSIAQLCRAMSSQLRHLSTIGKRLVKQQCHPHMSSPW